MLKIVILNILNVARKLRWKMYKFFSKKLASEIPELRLSDNDRLLVLAPHADDELIGCHSLMMSNISQTTIVYCSFLGRNKDFKNRELRESEFKIYMKSLKTASFFISSPDKLIDDLYMIINKVKPTIIALPSYIDWHPEHRKINEILLSHKNIIRDVRILWYHLSLPIPYKYINRVVRMDRVSHSMKWQYFYNSYKSQTHIDIERFAFVEGLFCHKGKYIESFYEHNIDSLKRYISQLSKYEHSLDELKQTLGNIKQMVKHTTKFYSNLYE